MLTRWAGWAVLAAATLATTSTPAARAARPPVPTPASILGAAPCADYAMATAEQIGTYFRALAAASDRIRLIDIGPTTEGRRQHLAVIAAPDTLRQLDRYQGIARALALNRGADGAPLTEAAARQLAASGRVTIWLDFGLHSTESAPTQAAPDLAWQLVTGETPEIRRIRDRALVVLVPDMNPDGTTLVADWYRQHRGTPWELTPPSLFHRYAGHDNNRDWFMFTQRETRNIARQLYEEFLPQIVYDHHQAPPFPARMFVPPFSEPTNAHIPDPVLRGIDRFGRAIQTRLAAEGKRGVVSRIGYDTWWNGGMRTAPYFHNMIGLLTETAHSSPTPSTDDAATFPRTFANGQATHQSGPTYAHPYRGGLWTLRQSCEYIVSASLAVLTTGANDAAGWQYGAYAMARDAMRAGDGEFWVIPARQWDPGAAQALVEALRTGGIQVEQAAGPFVAGGRDYARGAFIIRGAQPFLPAVRDLLTPQRYPDRRTSQGHEPEEPYDITGWTLSLQMGVEVHRVEGRPPVTGGPVQVPVVQPGLQTGAGAGPFILDARANAAFTAVNRLLRAGAVVARATRALETPAGSLPPGAFLVRPREGDTSVPALARALGLPVVTLGVAPDDPVVPIRPRRIAVYSQWGGNTDEGWTRWVLEGHEFPFSTARDADIRAGNLRDRWDVLLLPSASYAALRDGVPPGRLPEAYTGGLGEAGIRHLRQFVMDGGTLVAQDRAAELPPQAFGLPVAVVRPARGRRDLYVPGSLLRLELDTSHPLAWGLPAQVAAFIAESPVFALQPARQLSSSAPGPAPSVAARYDGTGPLLSGWAVGADRLRGVPAVVEVALGQGRVILLGLRSQHRGQALGTYKLLFNAIMREARTLPWSALR